MQTHLSDDIRHTPAGEEADDILRRCVHCGFCTATCPTYQLLGDELDGPRGRIYLIKSVLEGGAVSRKSREHLDRCLTCRSCETTCPSGVRFHRLLDIGREIVARKVPRSGVDALTRFVLKEFLPRRKLFSAALTMGRMVKGILPAPLADHIPRANRVAGPWPQTHRARRMLIMAGCVQPAMEPNINTAAARVLDALGIELVDAREAGCCGALRHHLDAQEAAAADMKRNIDAWWPWVEEGVEGRVEALVTTASGCGVLVKEYGHLLRNDEKYAHKAARISALAKDIGEVLLGEQAGLLKLLAAGSAADSAARSAAAIKVAFHSPCTLQHGQNIRGVVETLLVAAGFELTPVADAHLCCGSAGTYSILQPELSKRLRDNKLAALTHGEPDVIATANIGCLAHFKSGTHKDVRHWIELLEQRLLPGNR